jgi:signal transduction histidine kinase
VKERLPEQVEITAYYVIAEALSNAAKHARASAVTVQTEVADDILLLAVRDDGAGGADFTHGTGLAGLRDRVEALGGRISLHSPRGAGTSLRAFPPLRSPVPSAGPRGRLATLHSTALHAIHRGKLGRCYAEVASDTCGMARPGS